jgi:hypothetical protein
LEALPDGSRANMTLLWTSLRWNWANSLVIAAFCLLPFLTLPGGAANDQRLADATVSAGQYGNSGLANNNPVVSSACVGRRWAAQRSGQALAN